MFNEFDMQTRMHVIDALWLLLWLTVNYFAVVLMNNMWFILYITLYILCM